MKFRVSGLQYTLLFLKKETAINEMNSFKLSFKVLLKHLSFTKTKDFDKVIKLRT